MPVPTGAKVSPLVFFRFVDFHVADVLVQAHWQEITASFQCSGLYVGIADVFTSLQLIQLNARVSSLSLTSYLAGSSEAPADDGQQSTRSGVWLKVPGSSARCDFDLNSLRLVGCKLEGSPGEELDIGCNANFVEKLVQAYAALVQRGFGAGSTRQKSAQRTDRPPRQLIPRLEVMGLWLRVRGSSHDDVQTYSLMVSAEIHRLTVEQQRDPKLLGNASAVEDDVSGKEVESVVASPPICVNALVKNVQALVGEDPADRLVDMSTIEIQVKQSEDSSRRHVVAGIEACGFRMNPRAEANLCGLLAARDRIKALQQVHRLGDDDEFSSEELADEVSVASEVINLELQAQSWEAVFEIYSRGEEGRRTLVECEGRDCSVESTIENGEQATAKHNVSVENIQARVTFPSCADEPCSSHCVTLSTVEVAMKKAIQRELRTRDVTVCAKFGEACVNDYKDSLASQNYQSPALPAALFRGLVVKRDDHVSPDVTESLVDVQVEDLGVNWSHRHHVAFLAPILKLDSAVEAIDLMLSLKYSKQRPRTTQRRGSGGLDPDPDEIPKVTSITLTPQKSTIRLNDISGIADCVTLTLADTKLRHKKTHLDITTSFECASTRLAWQDDATAVAIAALAFNQRAVLGRQRFMVKTPSQSSISMTSMEIHMHPGRKLLALLLQVDALSNSDAEQRPESRLTPKHRPTAQSMAIDCSHLMIEVHYRRRLAQPAASSLAVEHRIAADASYLIKLNTFSIKLTKANLSESNDAMLRFVQKMRSCTGSANDLSTRSFDELVSRAVTMEGVVAAESMLLERRGPMDQLAHCREVEVHFALTDIEWQHMLAVANDPVHATSTSDSCTALRSLLFDASIFSDSIVATVERRELEDSLRVLQTIQESMDTEIKPPFAHHDKDETSREDSQKTNFRFRFAGNIDVGVHKWTLDFPYGGGSSTLPCYGNFGGLGGTKVMRVVINEVVLSTRQFQRMSLQLDSMSMYLINRFNAGIDAAVDADVDEAEGEMECVRLVFLPAISANVLLHWQDEWVRAALPQSSASQEFSVSADIALRQHPALCAWPSGAVPSLNEALFSLNWDYVYPWLICMVTDDEDAVGGSRDTEREADCSEDGKIVSCKGIQWDLSLGTIQVVWWDGMTQEQGIMVVAGELVSHGIALHSPNPSATSKPTGSVSSSSSSSYDSAWRVVDLTVYLDRLHGYLLHESAAPRSPVKPAAAGTGDNLADEDDAIPFDRVGNSEFFWETMGTSYRLVATNESASGDTEEEMNDLFGDLNAHVLDKMHDGFVPIDYGFSLNAATKLRKLDSLARSQSIQISSLNINTSVGTGSASPAPSPRAAKNWSHTIRSRLSRLKRRTASMDNLLLNDGSCPIQVDSMKLLWTLETRDAVFYMVAVLVDSFQLLQDALDQRRQQQQASSKSPCEGELPSGVAAVGALGTVLHTQQSGREPGTSVLRPPETVSGRFVKTRIDAEVSEPPPAPLDARLGRRGSTRDTLLDLLMQGKLGMKTDTDVDGAPQSSNAPTSDTDADDSDTGEIALKHYTVDIHDVQINMRDDNSRSSVLVAADRIHLEVGLDASRTKSVVKLTFDVVTAHVAPIDVDIAAPVLWYSNAAGVGSGPGSRRFSGASPSTASSASSSLLKQVLEECSLSSTYTQVRASGASTIDADLSFLQVTADRHQFYQMLNVVRHVLLAPPSTTIRGRSRRGQTSGSRTSQADSTVNSHSVDGGDTPASSTPVGVPTKKLYAQMVEELRARELKTLNTAGRASAAAVAFKSIAFRALGLQMRLRLSPEIAGADYEFVEIRVEGLTGLHTYYVSQSTKFELNLQWMEVTNLRPGQSSIAFDDAMSVLRAKILVEERLHHPSGASSVPKSMLESFSSSSRLASNQKGMLSVRAESGPVVRVLGQKLRVLDVLEVSMFPEVSNMIVIQLAADFYELVYKFFFAQTLVPEGNGDLTSEQLLFGRKVSNAGGGSSAASAGTGSSSCSTPTASSASTSSAGGMLSSPSIRSRLQAPSLLMSSGSSRRRSIQTSSNTSSTSNTSFSIGDPSGSSSGDTGDDDDSGPSSSSEADGCELFYFKYVRFGNVRLRINCNGFFVNLNNFDLDLPPFVCQSRLYTGQKLLQKFESHLKWYITKESASSGLSQFKNRLLKWTPSGSLSLSSSSLGSSGGVNGSEKKDRAKRQDGDDTAALNAQVLFGPYSGATT